MRTARTARSTPPYPGSSPGPPLITAAAAHRRLRRGPAPALTALSSEAPRGLDPEKACRKAPEAIGCHRTDRTAATTGSSPDPEWRSNPRTAPRTHCARWFVCRPHRKQRHEYQAYAQQRESYTHIPRTKLLQIIDLSEMRGKVVFPPADIAHFTALHTHIIYFDDHLVQCRLHVRQRFLQVGVTLGLFQRKNRKSGITYSLYR